MTYNEAIKRECNALADLLISKRADYGTKTVMMSPFGKHVQLLSRMWEKLCRLENLTSKTVAPKNEPIADSYMDLAGSSILGKLLSQDEFDLPLE